MIDRDSRAERNAYINLSEICSKEDSNSGNLSYRSFGADFRNLSKEISNKISEFQTQISQIPIVSMIQLWADHYKHEAGFDYHHIERIYELIDKKLIVLKHNKKKELLTLSDLIDRNSSGIGYYSVINSIRCYNEWSIEKREGYIKSYNHFIEWVSKETFGYISQPYDPDYEISKGRLLKFDMYIKIINNLFLRERALAKIFYLGCSRSIEDVLSLKISDVNFKENYLKFPEGLVDYPQHVFDDLKEYIGARKKGFLFISREGNQIDHTVPYRALKLVTNKLDLDKSFTFLDFMKSA